MKRNVESGQGGSALGSRTYGHVCEMRAGRKHSLGRVGREVVLWEPVLMGTCVKQGQRGSTD